MLSAECETSVTAGFEHSPAFFSLASVPGEAGKEIRFSLALNTTALTEAQAAIKPMQEHVSGGRPGARAELATLEGRAVALQQQRQVEEDRLLTVTNRLSDLTRRDGFIARLARDHDLTAGQVSQLEAGDAKSEAELAKLAQRFQVENKGAAAQREYSFGAGVAW